MISLQAKSIYDKLKTGDEQTWLSFIQESLDKDKTLKQKEEDYIEVKALYESEIEELKADKNLFRSILEREYL